MTGITIGIDLGGTHMRAGLVKQGSVVKYHTLRVNSGAAMEEVLNDLFALTDTVAGESFESIGVGVPSVVDAEKGIVYDVQNIPSWKEVHLKAYMEGRYKVPVFVNNDANCFALAEHRWGKGKGHHSLVGLTIGTGLGAGVVIHDKLYTGANCGAGEFGMVRYLDHCFEYYASGQFFPNVYGLNGEEVYQRALAGDGAALAMYKVFGHHLGQAIKMILYTYDPEIILIGGSLKRAWNFYAASMWEVIHTLVYPQTVKRLRIEVSEMEHSGVLGAALLGA